MKLRLCWFSKNLNIILS